jgi:hypothetical protein
MLLTGEEVQLPIGASSVHSPGYFQDAHFGADRWLIGLLRATSAAWVLAVHIVSGLFPRLIAESLDCGMRGGTPKEDWILVVSSRIPVHKNRRGCWVSPAPSPFCFFSFSVRLWSRYKHRVDDVDHTVGHFNVGDGDHGVVDHRPHLSNADCRVRHVQHGKARHGKHITRV